MTHDDELATIRPRLTQPIKWHGGKHYLARKLITLMPPHLHYVEPFFGGGSVLLSKNPIGVSEVATDLNGDLMNFWRVLQAQDAFEQFHRRIDATPFSQVEWNVATDCTPRSPLPDVEAAVRFFIRARQSRQGLMRDFATLSRNRTRREMNEQVSSWLTAVEGLPDVHDRLHRVAILSQDALAVIRSEDGPNTLFYLDPPYLPKTRVSSNDYSCEMTADDHEELLETLANIEGRFLLSGYPSDIYEDAAHRHGWTRTDFAIDNKASSKKSKPKMTECVWRN